MATVFYDANGNPIISPQQTGAQGRLPPEAPTTTLRATNQPQLTQQQPQPQGGSQSNQNQPAQGGGGGSYLTSLLNLLRNQQNQQVTPATPATTQQSALAQGTQVGPPNPSQDQNTNPMVSGAIGGSSGPTQSQKTTSSAIGAIGGGLSQLGQDIANSVPSWKIQPSAIPDPSQFIQQEQRAEQQYDFTRNPIV